MSFTLKKEAIRSAIPKGEKKKEAGSWVVLLPPEVGDEGPPSPSSLASVKIEKEGGKEEMR